GGLAIAAFVVVRGIDRYGDPDPWSPQASATFTLMSFLDCSKYPPSLDYLLMTLGPIAWLLVLFEPVPFPEPALRVIETFGRVPLFFYVTHLYLLSISSRALAAAGLSGWSLGAVYAVWAIAIAILYLPCAWFARLKERRGKDWWWLSY